MPIKKIAKNNAEACPFKENRRCHQSAYSRRCPADPGNALIAFRKSRFGLLPVPIG